MILVDTSVYISALADNEVEKMLKEAHNKAFIISSEVIEKEINLASDFLRKRGKSSDAQKLKDLYNSAISGTIKLTGRVVELSDKYAKEVSKRISRARALEMKDDFRIVSSATIGGIEAVATFNRKTMANPEIVSIYKEVNSTNKLKTPSFARTKEELSKLLSA
ncbi:MAG: hypothetical protein NT129_00255 [Candidatus Aenigmarchaeota archaeon]|nr:hypothetical protein [Candidatus Aenigmarchaeota archaeon]